MKSVLGVAHAGLRDWVIQRLTAVILTLFTVALVYLYMTHPLNYLEWRMLFYPTWAKIFTLLVALSFASHAWVGIWTIVTDYVHPAVLRFLVHLLVFFTLVFSVLWTLFTVWSL